VGCLKISKMTIIDFLFEAKILSFGDFQTKSGRNSPFFFNFGQVNSGAMLINLARFYYDEINRSFPDCNLVFGPAYKGIPLCVATAIVSASMSEGDLTPFSANSLNFSFDRKEQKEHGDKGLFVGKTPMAGDKIVIIEDAITAGTTLKQLTPILQAIDGAEILGAILAVDREEKSQVTDSVTAKSRLSTELKIPIVALTSISEILSDTKSEKYITTEQRIKTENYLKTYGVV
jgi:orotate phosphoribosyltransferase